MTLADRLRAALEEGHRRDIGVGPEGVIDPRIVTLGAPVLSPAAVLVAVTDRPEPGLILTLRSSALRKHAGQVAFPGGRVDPEDKDVVEAALREAWEEIAMPRDQVDIVGITDRYHAFSGFDIVPVLAVVPPDLPYVPHEAEVDSVFEVPLRFALNPANRQRTEYELEGKPHFYFEMNWADRRIWGVTAAIIHNLSKRLCHDSIAS